MSKDQGNSEMDKKETQRVQPIQFFLLWMSLLLIAACAPINKRVFFPQAPIRNRIPPLEVHIVDPNLDLESPMGTIVPRERVEEARYIIKRDFRDNVFDSSAPAPAGHIVLRLDRQVDLEWSWLWASTLTLYVPNLVGVPLAAQKATVGIDAEILDLERRSLATYSVEGHGKEYSAMYWGRFTPLNAYVSTPGTQMVHAEALHDALTQLKDKIEADAPRLRGLLASPLG